MEKGQKPLGDLLRDARAVTGIGQEEAAQRIRVTVRTYGDWERGKHTPSGKHLHALARTLGLDYVELAEAASGHSVPVDVEAAEARRAADDAAAEVAGLQGQVEALAKEVERLQGLVRAYEGPTEEQLRAVVDVVVAARLAELDATPGAPARPDAAPRERGQQSA